MSSHIVAEIPHDGNSVSRKISIWSWKFYRENSNGGRWENQFMNTKNTRSRGFYYDDLHALSSVVPNSFVRPAGIQKISAVAATRRAYGTVRCTLRYTRGSELRVIERGLSREKLVVGSLSARCRDTPNCTELKFIRISLSLSRSPGFHLGFSYHRVTCSAHFAFIFVRLVVAHSRSSSFHAYHVSHRLVLLSRFARTKLDGSLSFAVFRDISQSHSERSGAQRRSATRINHAGDTECSQKKRLCNRFSTVHWLFVVLTNSIWYVIIFEPVYYTN